MSAFAKVYNKGGTDKTVIHNVRAGLNQPFDAPDWLDLRVGFLLSLTQAGADDTITGLGETIGSGTVAGPQDRYWIGLKDAGPVMPSDPGAVFMGFCNAFDGNGLKGSSVLATSDSAIGTTNANFWRPKNGESFTGDRASSAIFDGILPVGGSAKDGMQQHFAQNTVGAGGYATLLMLRVTRPSVTSKLLTMTMKADVAGHNGDVLYTNTPTFALLQSNMEAFPGTVQQIGPVTLSAVPTAIYIYWPFHNSRLRNHATGFVKVL